MGNEEITLDRRVKLADHMRAAAKIDKPVVQTYIHETAKCGDLNELMYQADPVVFAAAEQWVAEQLDRPTLIAPKKPDNFTTESPIRAFTEFKVAGNYAIGKGFRPSLAHLAQYLDAMLSKEGWGFMQVILPRDSDGDPTIMFEKGLPSFDDLIMPELAVPYTPPEDPDNPDQRPAIEREIDAYDDANPAHYAGWECGDIGERLSANGYQILKYCWRLGKKDDPCKEIGKAIRYCEREIALLDEYAKDSKVFVKPNIYGLRVGTIDDWFRERIGDQSQFTKNIARMLWEGYDRCRLKAIHEALLEHRFHLDCGRGLAI
jgi:hypothetical protein